jgi:AcrR family transcriptional regulator
LAEAYVKADERRRQLVAAARRVLGRQGLAGSTLRAVAAEAGVPLGTVHYIFASKELLLRAVLEDVVDQVTATLAEATGDIAEVEAAMLAGARAAWAGLVETDPAQQLMQYELTIWALRASGMEHLARWQYERYLDVLTTAWERLAERARVTYAVPARELARLQLAAGDGLILQYLTNPDADRATGDLDTLTRQLVRLAAPTPVNGRRAGTAAGGPARRTRRR